MISGIATFPVGFAQYRSSADLPRHSLPQNIRRCTHRVHLLDKP